MSELTTQMLRELLHYEPETGAFAWRNGRRAGTWKERGYVVMQIFGRRYRAHRLAWLYVHGKWPESELDHINGDSTDNRIANLRDVSRRCNAENRHKVRSDSFHSGLIGVTWSAYHGKWKALIRVNGRIKHLKYCSTKEEARAAYVAAKRIFHAGCTI